MISGLKSFGWKIVWLTIFAIAMAYLESAVVVYLRAIYYPAGFAFPLKAITGSTIWIELGREVATLVMLAAVGILFAATGAGRFAAICFAFGVWDIFYYLWLKIFINWPESLMTWDLLFLIPAPWIGPVIAPILVSLCLITAGTIILANEHNNLHFHPAWWSWWLEIIAGLLIILAFLSNLPAVIQQSIPRSFPWWMFLIGLIGGIAMFLMMFFHPHYFKALNATGNKNENSP
jgi:hypothetical protein